MANRVRALARALPSPLDRVLERSHARYVGERVRRRAERHGETTRRDASGRPIPPPRLVRLVALDDDVEKWLATGAVDAGLIRRLLAENGVTLNDLGAILDFGCGCGRVARWWDELSGPAVYGCDYDGVLTGWCRRNLPFLSVKTNASVPPLPFRRESFDFIYAISLFTHLDAAAQHAWIPDVHRVLRPGGLFLFTVHGERFTGLLSEPDRAAFGRGEAVVLDPDRSGQEGCAAFHPPSYVREHLLPLHGLELVAAVYEDRDEHHAGSPLGLQDNYLVRKAFPRVAAAVR
jgi:SAM-dependent methyltransferase